MGGPGSAGDCGGLAPNPEWMEHHVSRQHGRRRVVALALAVVGGAASLAGCSAGDSAGAGAAGTDAAGATAAAANALVACNRLYALDLFRQTTVHSARSLDDQQKSQALKDYRELSSSLVSALAGAVTIGALPASTQTSAERIDRTLARISRSGGNVSDVTGAVDARIARKASRIEAACAAASVPVPQENLDARQSAEGD